MAVYIIIDDIIAEIPRNYLVVALDDDKDGEIDSDVWTAIQAKIGNDIDAPLSGRYQTPFSEPLPAVVKQAAFSFALEIIHRRRGIPDDKNPAKAEADRLRDLLVKIGKGEEKMDAAVRALPGSGGVVISAPAKTHTCNRLMV